MIKLEIVGIQADVWRQIAFNISEKCKEEVTPASLRVRVPLDRGGIKQKLGIESIESNKVEEPYQKNGMRGHTSVQNKNNKNN